MALAVFLGLLATHCCPMLAVPDRKEMYVEDEWPMRRSYRLEDFLWTGSGDGQDGSGSSWRATTTVFRTTTVMTTVFPSTLYRSPPPPELTPTPSATSVPADTIRPTPTLATPPASVGPTWPPLGNATAPDQRFWLLTVLQTNASDPPTLAGQFEARLARLYRIAFHRQQERHLGIGNATALAIIRKQELEASQARARRARERRLPEPVSVQLLNITSRQPGASELLYSVHVAGRPVLAQTAAADMRLVSDAEVSAELGYPVLTKAEPYLKGALPLDGGLRGDRSRDTWLLVGGVIAAVCLLLLLLALLVLGLGKRKRNKRRVLAGGIVNRRQVFEKEVGAKNLGYEDDDTDSKIRGASSSKAGGTKSSPRFMDVAPPASVTFQDDSIHRRDSSTSASSSSHCSEASLVRRRPGLGAQSRERRTNEEAVVQPQPRKRQHTSRTIKEQHQHQSRLKKIRPPMTDTDGCRMQEPTIEDIAPRRSPPPVTRINSTISPNSFLSMPSIKAFPRGANIPEPLARVLEPVSVRHLDSDIVGIVPEPRRRLVRHGSVEGEDPGVLGPLVWDLHCHRLQCHQKQSCLEETVEDLILAEAPEDPSPPDTSTNVGKMRRRFHELLDDAFSLFGSRSGSPGAEEESSSPPTLHRVHSAIVRHRPVDEPLLRPSEAAPRPRTSDPRRPSTAVRGMCRPRGAWGTTEHSPRSGRAGTLPRPLSAGPFHRPQLPAPILVEPSISRTLILSDSHLAPTDPAVPLIAAIKEELRKFQGTQAAIALPGSTSAKP